jgi:antitoxin component of MazEF toxin-antitoxin module
MLTKKLSKVGNSHAMFIDKSILSLIEADQDTVFKVLVEGHKIVLEPVSKKELKDYTMKKAREMMKIHEPVLKKLAK